MIRKPGVIPFALDAGWLGHLPWGGGRGPQNVQQSPNLLYDEIYVGEYWADMINRGHMVTFDIRYLFTPTPDILCFVNLIMQWSSLGLQYHCYPIIIKRDKDINYTKISGEFDYGRSASLNMYTMGQLMRPISAFMHCCFIKSIKLGKYIFNMLIDISRELYHNRV